MKQTKPRNYIELWAVINKYTGPNFIVRDEIGNRHFMYSDGNWNSPSQTDWSPKYLRYYKFKLLGYL